MKSLPPSYLLGKKMGEGSFGMCYNLENKENQAGDAELLKVGLGKDSVNRQVAKRIPGESGTLVVSKGSSP
jgi:hypothetical protein